jgi:transposase
VREGIGRLIEEGQRLLDEERRRREYAEWQLKKLQAQLFGSRGEKMDPEQLQLLLEGFVAAAVIDGSGADAAIVLKESKGKKPSRRMFFPGDLPEEVLEFDLPEGERTCPQTGAERRFIRWEQTEKIHFIPGHFKRLVIRRAVRAVPFSAQEASAEPVETPVVTAAMPAEYRVIPGAVATAGLLAYLMVAKYCDHLPFYRLQQIFQRRHKVLIDRGAMCHWMGRCAELLGRLYEALRKELVSGQYLQIDETTVKLLDPDSPGKAKNSYFWVIVRPGEGVLFRFDPGRAHTVAMDLLEGFSGRLQSDAFGAYQTLASKSPGLETFACWAHARRKFVEAVEANGAGAAWYVAEIQRLYRTEAEARRQGLDHEARAALRAQRSVPVLASIKAKLDADSVAGHLLPSSPLAIAVRYTAKIWAGLTRYAEPGNGMIEVDNNLVENAIRPSAIGKKNWLFIGHPKAGQRSAVIYTMVENCRMHGIDPLAYLEDVMPRIVDRGEAEDVGDLLPRQWKAARHAG